MTMSTSRVTTTAAKTRSLSINDAAADAITQLRNRVVRRLAAPQEPPPINQAGNCQNRGFYWNPPTHPPKVIPQSQRPSDVQDSTLESQLNSPLNPPKLLRLCNTHTLTHSRSIPILKPHELLLSPGRLDKTAPKQLQRPRPKLQLPPTSWKRQAKPKHSAATATPTVANKSVREPRLHFSLNLKKKWEMELLLLLLPPPTIMKLMSVVRQSKGKARQHKAGLGAQTRGRRVRRGSYKHAMRLGE